MAHSDAHGHGSHGHDAHAQHGSWSVYIAVAVTLLVLTFISFAEGGSHTLRENAPGVMWAAMMAVSCAKAMLVILFFMHLKWEANWKYVLTIPASIMSMFLVLMLIPDIGFRTRHYSEERLLHATEPVTAHHAEHHAGHEKPKAAASSHDKGDH